MMDLSVPPTLVRPGDPILREVMPEFDFANPPVDPIKYGEYIAKAMVEFEGIGLAANQLGHRLRVCVIKADPKVLIYFNPKIVNVSDELVMLEEMCLSFPGISVKVKRPKTIRFRYTYADGTTETERFTGMTARIIQHEISHLNGEIFAASVSRLQLELAMKKANKRGQTYLLSDLL